jgi:NAD(P)-dependent dehydrogenase (short-subunit alcohol dehydrogenase family)
LSVLEDRRIVVVGASGGLGRATVDELHREGARILGTGRNEERLRAVAELGVEPVSLDLHDPDSPMALRTEVDKRFEGVLDGLVLVAGSLGSIGPTRTVDLEAVARTFAEHTLASLGLVQACAGPLDAADAPSVVMFSGGGATSSFPSYTAYSLAKVALVRLVENLAAEEPGWKVNAVSPGFVATEIHKATFEAGPEAAGSYFDETQRRLANPAPPSAAAELVAFLLGDESAGITGRLISAVWDDWRSEEVRAQLRDSEAFGRLRRIDGEQFREN